MALAKKKEWRSADLTAGSTDALTSWVDCDGMKRSGQSGMRLCWC